MVLTDIGGPKYLSVHDLPDDACRKPVIVGVDDDLRVHTIEPLLERVVDAVLEGDGSGAASEDRDSHDGAPATGGSARDEDSRCCFIDGC